MLRARTFWRSSRDNAPPKLVRHLTTHCTNMSAEFNKEFSGLKCAGGFLIFLGIVFLPEVYISIPALIVGCSVGCCTQGSVSAVKQQAGCAKCCSITGIIFQALAIIAYIVVGVWFMTVVLAACELTAGMGGACSRRSLLENELGPMTTSDAISKHMPGYLPTFEHRFVDALAQFADWREKMTPPALFHEVDGVPVTLPLPDGGRMLTMSSDRCRTASDGDCDDGGVGSEFAICPLCSDVSDCGCTAACGCACSSRDLNDGICDDGGPGAEYARCAYGTDPVDCGYRGSGTSSNGTATGTGTGASDSDIDSMNQMMDQHCQNVREEVDRTCSFAMPVGVVILTVPTLFAILFFSAFGCVLCKLGNIENMSEVPVVGGVAMAQPAVIIQGGKV